MSYLLYYKGRPNMTHEQGNRNRTVREEQASRTLFRENVRATRKVLGQALAPRATAWLEILTRDYRFSVNGGDLRIINGHWYVTHTGLLRLERRKKCTGINVAAVNSLCDSALSRFVLKATVYPSKRSSGFVGYGDADPSNVSPLVRGAEMRVAETRAVNRALRKAYGIGLCSVEELGWLSGPPDPAREPRRQPAPAGGNGSGNGQPRLRDRLCLLIRQHQLDPTLVKRYAADFCGTETLREASRDLVESFINNLAAWAAKDREGLLCKLNSYSQSEEVHS